MLNHPLVTPCIQICQLDENFYCYGCGRSKTEIAHWRNYSDTERAQIMQRLKAAQKGRNS